MIAGGLCAARDTSRAGFRSAAYAASAIANNIPDIDPVYTWITQPPPLGSLLHHRGHTHTLPVAWLFGLIVSLSVIALSERRSGQLSKRDRAYIVALGVLGATLHILMDYGNNYGVHPFWPLDSRWVYGDSIFIVEPLWLGIALPVLASAVQTRWFAWLLWGLLGCVIALAIWLPFVTTGGVLALAAVSGLMILASRLGSLRTRFALAWLAYLGVAACFVGAAGLARTRLREALAVDHGRLQIADIATSPLPGNPLCWMALVVGQQAANYRVLSASVAPWPGIIDAAACPYDADARPTADIAPLAAGDSNQVRWRWSYTRPLSQLRELSQQDCCFRAWLRFARVPAVSNVTLPDSSGSGSRVASDLRYDRSPGLDFADMALGARTSCPDWVPPWIPPRADLLGHDGSPLRR